MKQLEPVFQVINAILLEQLKIGFSVGDSLQIYGALSRLLLERDGTASPNGLIIEDLKFGLENLQLPSPASPGISVTGSIYEVTLKFAPEFWARAAVLAKDPLVANLGKLLDRIHVRNLKVKLDLDANKVVDVEIWQDHLEITLDGHPGITVDDVHVALEGFDLQEKDKKLAIKKSRLIIHTVETGIAEEFLNRAVDVARKKIPPLVQSLDMDLSYERMLVTAKLSVFPLAIPIELTFSAKENLFGIYIVKVGVWGASKIVMGLVQQVAKNRPEIEVMDSKVFINPWGKIPIPIVCNLKTFAVKDRKIVVGFAPPLRIPERPNARPAAVLAAPAVEESPIVVSSQEDAIPPMP